MFGDPSPLPSPSACTASLASSNTLSGGEEKAGDGKTGEHQREGYDKMTAKGGNIGAKEDEDDEEEREEEVFEFGEVLHTLNNDPPLIGAMGI